MMETSTPKLRLRLLNQLGHNITASGGPSVECLPGRQACWPFLKGRIAAALRWLRSPSLTASRAGTSAPIALRLVPNHELVARFASSSHLVHDVLDRYPDLRLGVALKARGFARIGIDLDCAGWTEDGGRDRVV